MSHAPSEVQSVILNEDDGTAPIDTPAYETRTYWRAGDDACDTTLPDGSIVVSARGDEVQAVKLDIQGRVSSGSSTPVTKSHLDDLGITAAILAWAQD